MVATLTETVAGEMVTLMLVAGSVQVDVEDVEEVPDVVVVQVIPVLAGAWWQEVRVKRARSKGNKSGRFTAPLSSLFDVPNAFGSVSTLIPKR